MTPRDFLVIAHRGASSYAPENTIAAFDLALQMGVRHIELDVHLSRDGHLVVIHDDTMYWT
jgi:glycerophosphoryl diester phosphodiesterase